MDNRILLDSSAIIATIVDEPEGDIVSKLTQDKIIASPYIVQIEFVNALTRMMRKRTIDREGMITALQTFKKLPLKFIDVNFENVIEISWKYKIYAYDACYLEVAQRMNLPLLTFDVGMGEVGKDMKLTILGGNYANV
jgi:predicted nucleic acid-binding protein